MTIDQPRSGLQRVLSALRTLPLRYVVRGLLLLAIVVGGLLLLRWPPIASQLTQENVTDVLSRLRGLWYAPLLLIAAYAVIAPIGMPVSPLVIGGGAVFGTLWGSLINLGGLFLGAITGFIVARLLGRDAVAHLTGPRLRRAERVFDRRGFWPLVQTRFLPVPFALINFGAALAGVRTSRFLASTAIGLVPTTVMHTYFSARMTMAGSDERPMIGLWWLVVWILLGATSAIPSWRDGRQRRRRYRDLVAQRALR